MKRWGESYDSKGGFPELISKLVYATTPKSTRVHFPSGSGVFLGGWDGKVVCEESTHFIPIGVSCFELGTERNPGSKIERDYNERTKDPLGCDPKETTFILITPFTWQGKEAWVKEKNSEGIWKEVIVYDAIDLEEWLDRSIIVTRRFIKKIYPNRIDSFLTAEEEWEEWSNSVQYELPPEIVVTGRKDEKDKIYKFLKGEPGIIGVKASARKEAIAFIIACGKLIDQEESERFLSKTLVVDNINDFRSFSNSSSSSLNLISDIECSESFNIAVKKSHHVFVALGAQDEFRQETIELPNLDREGLIKIIIDLGIEEDTAKRYVLESGRNITILKKLLGFELYVKYEDVREIIPALLLGRWNEGFEGDIELIEKLSGKKYTEYSAILNKWKNIEDSPLIQIGNVWRLTSPLDLWTSLSKYIIADDLDALKECFEMAFFNGNPDIVPEKETFYSSYFKRKKYSNFSREGLVQSLILVGLRGDSLQIPHSQQWVDSIINELLYDASAELWVSVDKELPLIAEVSPKSFFKAVSNSLEKSAPEVLEMFKEGKGLVDSTYHYTGLLWALESLAWHPEHLMQSASILLKLDTVIPELKWVNSPMNSLVEIFKPWHFQTLSPYEDRMEVLKQISSKEKDSGWKLLIKLLPQGHEIANSTHKTRWRIFDLNTNLSYTYNEIFDTHCYVLDLLINLFNGDETKFSELIENTVLFPYQEDRLKVYDWAEKVCDDIEQKEYKPWHTIREILYRHRSYPDSDWSLPESELQRLEMIYNKLEPDDIVEKNKWLFDKYWPSFPEGMDTSDTDSRDYKKNNEPRIEAVKLWIKELGLEKTISLRKELTEPRLLGEALAEIISDEKDLITICECLKGDLEDIKFGQSFIRYKSRKENLDWIKGLVILLQGSEFDVQAISNVLASINSYKKVYEYIETLSQELQNAYWSSSNASYGYESVDDAIYVIKKLNSFKRYYTALKVISSIVEELPVDLVLETLFLAISEVSSEPDNFERYELNRIFEVIYQKDDLDKSLMIKIEWNYIFLFDRYFPLKPKYLEDEMTDNPSFFIELIKWIYFPNDRDKYYEEKKGVSEENIRIKAQQSKILLDSRSKVPGMREDNSINVEKLRSWIDEARHLAAETDRIEVADMEIGTLLSKLPEDSEQLPSHEIYRLMEEINSKELNSSYSNGLFNKRGSTVRGPYDGGDIERGHASYFGDLSKKYRNRYPNVSEIFSDLEQTYLEQAKYEDDQAKLEGLEY
ncbi:MAG: hypothetical protein PHQ67_04845 [Fermentimonas sp.]|nr:hypothetical protein [Fermentimonas sp.]